MIGRRVLVHGEYLPFRATPDQLLFAAPDPCERIDRHARGIMQWSSAYTEFRQHEDVLLCSFNRNQGIWSMEDDRLAPVAAPYPIRGCAGLAVAASRVPATCAV